MRTLELSDYQGTHARIRAICDLIRSTGYIVTNRTLVQVAMHIPNRAMVLIPVSACSPDCVIV